MIYEWEEATIEIWIEEHLCRQFQNGDLGAVTIKKTVLPGVAIPMLKIRRPNGRLIFNIGIAIPR